MYNLIRVCGLVLLLAYCIFNLTNVLYFQVSVAFVGLLLFGVASTYFSQRIARAAINGLTVNSAEVLGFCLMGAGFLVLLLQRISYDTHIGFDGVNTHSALMSIWIVSTLWFLIGGSVAAAPLKEFPVLALLLAGGVTAAMGFGVDAELFQAFDIEGAESTDRASHLTVERYIVIPIVLAYALSPKTRWLVALCGVYCLFLLGGRTALFVFVITVVLMNITGNSVRNIFALVVMGAIMFLGLRYAVSEGILDPDNKQVKEILFLGGVEEDNSFNARVTLLKESLEDLPYQFFIGNFNLTVERYGRFGTYIHNLLSAWQFYGFFMFAAIVAALGYCLLQMLKIPSTNKRPLVEFSKFILIYTVISLLIGKYVGWSMLWFTLGLWMLRPQIQRHKSASAKRRSRHRRRRSHAPAIARS